MDNHSVCWYTQSYTTKSKMRTRSLHFKNFFTSEFHRVQITSELLESYFLELESIFFVYLRIFCQNQTNKVHKTKEWNFFY